MKILLLAKIVRHAIDAVCFFSYLSLTILGMLPHNHTGLIFFSSPISLILYCLQIIFTILYLPQDIN